jgi:hypothetical protein
MKIRRRHLDDMKRGGRDVAAPTFDVAACAFFSVCEVPPLVLNGPRRTTTRQLCPMSCNYLAGERNS